MRGEPTDEDRAAVLETVRVFFTDAEISSDELLCGPLRDWLELRGELPWYGKFEHLQTLEHAEIVELTETSAVVDVRAEHRAVVKRGFKEYRIRLDGPVALERVDGRWHVADYVSDGRRRVDSIVLGPLAEQEQAGVTVRVLGVDRSMRATQYLVELVNRGADEIRLARAFALFETQTAWARLGFDAGEPVPAGASRTVLLSSENVLELSDHVVAMALQVRAGSRRLPFVLKVPLVRPETVVPQRPPRHMPLLRSTWPRSLVFYAVLTVAAAWFYGWFALAVPLFVALSVYHQIRAVGALPDRLRRARFVLDALVVACAFLILWVSPATPLAVPALVATLVYVGLRPLGRKRAELRLVAALSIGFGWLFVLGTSTGPLSACRLFDGRPASTSDTFTRAVLTGDLERAHRYEPSYLQQLDRFALKPVSAGVAGAAVERRVGVSSSELWCRIARSEQAAVGCYRYPVAFRGKPAAMMVAMGCDGHRWRVVMWYP